MRFQIKFFFFIRIVKVGKLAIGNIFECIGNMRYILYFADLIFIYKYNFLHYKTNENINNSVILSLNNF